jgi:hypothetical protein
LINRPTYDTNFKEFCLTAQENITCYPILLRKVNPKDMPLVLFGLTASLHVIPKTPSWLIAIYRNMEEFLA